MHETFPATDLHTNCECVTKLVSFTFTSYTVFVDPENGDIK